VPRWRKTYSVTRLWSSASISVISWAGKRSAYVVNPLEVAEEHGEALFLAAQPEARGAFVISSTMAGDDVLLERALDPLSLALLGHVVVDD
jgi:hypothetical protein